MELDIIGKCDFSDINREIENTTRRIGGLEKELDDIDFDKLKNNLSDSLRINYKALGIEEMKSEYQSLETTVSNLTAISEKYTETVSSYKTLLDSIRDKQKALNDEYARAASVQDDKTMVACRKELRELGNEYSQTLSKLKEYESKLADVNKMSSQASDRLATFGKQVRANSVFEFNVKDMSSTLLEDRLLKIQSMAYDAQDGITALNNAIESKDKALSSMEGERAEKQTALDSGTLDAAATAEYKTRVEELDKAISVARENIANLQSAVNAYENQLNLANEATKKINDQLSATGATNPFDTQKMSVEELKTSIETTTAEVEKQQQAQENANAALEQAEKELERCKKLVASTGDEYVRSGYIRREKEAASLVEQRRKKLEEVNRELDKSVTKQRLYSEALTTKQANSPQRDIPNTAKLNGMQTAFVGLSKSLEQITKGFGLLSKGGASAAKGLALITSGVKLLGKSLLSLLANPIVAGIAAIIAVVMLTGKMLSNFFKNTTEGADAFASIKGVFEGVRAAIENFFMAISKKYGEFVTSFDKLSGIFVGFAKSLKVWATTLWNNITTWLSNAKNGLEKWMSGLKSAFSNFFNGDGFDTSGMQGAFDNINDGLKELGGAWDELKEATDTYKASFSDWDVQSLGEFTDTYKRLAEEERAMQKEKLAWEKTSAQLDISQSQLKETMYSGGQLQQLEAMNTMRDIINQKYAKEISFAKRELDIQKQKNQLSGNNTTIDQMKAQQELEINLLKLQAQRNAELSSTARRCKSVTDALYEQQKTMQKELTNLDKQQVQASRNAQYDEAIRALEFQKKYAADINQQLTLQAQLREQNLKKQLEQLDVEKQTALVQIEESKKSAIRKTYGEGALARYERGEEIEDTQGVLSFYNQKALKTSSNFDQRMDIARKTSEQKGAYEDLSADIDAYTNYVERIIELEQWKADQLQAIRDGESALTEQQVNQIYDKQKTQLQADNNIDDVEDMAADISANLTAVLSNAVWEDIQALGDEALAALDEQIAAIRTQKEAAQAELGTQAATDENGNEISPTGIYAEMASAEEEVAAGKEEAQERLNLLKEKERALTASTQNYDAQLVKMDTQRKSIQGQINTALQQGSNNTKKLTKEQKWDIVANSLSTVNKALDALANTMGGVLSKKSKKAVESMQTIVSFATQNINGIKMLVDVVSKGMAAAAGGAVAAMSAAEKASVILTIISLAIQAIETIVNIAMKFTESAKMQEAIDAQLDKVEELKRKNEELQRSYQNEAGIDYYKGMARAARDYNRIIAAQNEAVKKAEELYQRQVEKHGEDSGKAKDAAQQVDDIKKGLTDIEDAQADLIKEIQDSLITTDLSTFSQDLADSLIDGFENGKEGISDTWDDMLDDLLTSMLKKQLALQLEKQFQGVFNKMNGMVDNDGVLTQEEIDQIVELMNGASAGAEQIAAAYYDIMDEMGLLTDKDNTGSKGGFESMSQDTADELNARFTALQITGANIDATVQSMAQTVGEMIASDRTKTTLLQTLQENTLLGVQIAQNQLDQLRVIADNTGLLSETNRRLHTIEQHTDDI